MQISLVTKILVVLTLCYLANTISAQLVGGRRVRCEHGPYPWIDPIPFIDQGDVPRALEQKIRDCVTCNCTNKWVQCQLNPQCNHLLEKDDKPTTSTTTEAPQQDEKEVTEQPEEGETTTIREDPRDEDEHEEEQDTEVEPTTTESPRASEEEEKEEEEEEQQHREPEQELEDEPTTRRPTTRRPSTSRPTTSRPRSRIQPRSGAHLTPRVRASTQMDVEAKPLLVVGTADLLRWAMDLASFIILYAVCYSVVIVIRYRAALKNNQNTANLPPIPTLSAAIVHSRTNSRQMRTHFGGSEFF